MSGLAENCPTSFQFYLSGFNSIASVLTAQLTGRALPETNIDNDTRKKFQRWSRTEMMIIYKKLFT